MRAMRLARSYTKEELMKSCIGGLNQASFGFKKDYITVTKQGTLILEDMRIIWQKKRKFVLNMDRSSNILGLPDGLESSYSLEMSYIGTENYNESKQTEEKILTISKIANSQDVGLELVTRSQDLQTNYKMNMQMANIKVVKRLIEFSIPYLLGWNYLTGMNNVDIDEMN